MSMENSIFKAPIDLKQHTCLIYAEGVFGLDAREKHSMRAKTADGILRYAGYDIAGVVDSMSQESKAGDVLKNYLEGKKNFDTPIFQSLKEAKEKTNSDVLILGAAPEGGELPKEWCEDIKWAIENKMHIVSGMHFALADDKEFSDISQKNGTIIWDARKISDLSQIPVGSAEAYHVKKPIVLTVGTDAAIGKMTVAYEMHLAAKESGLKSCFIPTGQTAIMIEGWGAAVDALPADFMAGAVEAMILSHEEGSDIFFVEGQGSLFHPAYSNTSISLIHGAVPTHMVLVHRPQRKHSIGSKLVKLPFIKQAIHQYEESVLPEYRNAKVVAVALNSKGLSDEEYESHKGKISAECDLPVFDFVREKDRIKEIISKISN